MNLDETLAGDMESLADRLHDEGYAPWWDGPDSARFWEIENMLRVLARRVRSTHDRHRKEKP